VIACALVLLVLQRERRTVCARLRDCALSGLHRADWRRLHGRRYFALPLLASALLLALLLREQLGAEGATAYLPAAVMAAAGLLLTVHPTLGANVEYGLAIMPFPKAPWDERGVWR